MKGFKVEEVDRGRKENGDGRAKTERENHRTGSVEIVESNVVISDPYNEYEK